MPLSDARDGLFRAAVDSATDGLAITDGEGRYIYLNQAHLDMFGFADSDLVGQPWQTLYAEAEAERLARQAIPTVLGEGSWRGEATGRHKTGAPVHQEVVLTLHPHGGLVCATRDVSQRHEQERRTRLLEAELRQTERGAALFSLHNSLTHDFGNLLAAIDGFARLMHREPDARDINRTRVLSILQATTQAFDLVGAIAPSEELATTSVDLPALLQTTIAIARALKPDTLDLALAFEPGAAIVMTNNVLASRSLLNVIKNAIEAVDPGGAVAVRLQRRATSPLPGCAVNRLGADLAGYSWVIEIEDNGPGMTRDQLARLFTRGYTSKLDRGRAGLGMESVVALAETGLVGVEIQSAPGLGTRCVFRFLDADPVEDDVAPVMIPSRAMADPPSVLVVDDNTLVATMLVQTLSAAGFAASHVASGEAALACNLADLDAVVTDFRMPGMDGQDLAIRLKAARPVLPIIIYSGQGGHIARGALYSAVLAKPVDPAELVGAVWRALSRSASSAAP